MRFAEFCAAQKPNQPGPCKPAVLSWPGGSSGGWKPGRARGDSNWGLAADCVLCSQKASSFSKDDPAVFAVADTVTSEGNVTRNL